VEYLAIEPLLQLQAEKQCLAPGELIHAYPPFCSKESANGVSLSPVPARELLLFHSALARTIGPLRDGAQVRIVVDDVPPN
jgi:hypothetical protein